MLSNTLRLSFCYLKMIHILHPRYHLKIIKIKQKSKFVCIQEIMRLIIMAMEMKIKDRSHRYDIIRPRSRHGHNCSKYKKCLDMMMLIYIKQQLISNIWSSVHEKSSPMFKFNAEAVLKQSLLIKNLVFQFNLKY